jgi:hypothetical protein
VYKVWYLVIVERYSGARFAARTPDILELVALGRRWGSAPRPAPHSAPEFNGTRRNGLSELDEYTAAKPDKLDS